MSRIESKMTDLRTRGEKALVFFLVAGDPDIATTEKLILELAAAGADIVEIGIPFSDPLADGPSIQASSQRALEAGVDMKSVFDMVSRIREKSQIPIVFMTYFNPVNSMGVKKFAERASGCGADGVIMTDLPPEEAGEWKAAADEAGIDTVFLLAPTSTRERIERVASMASGFIYCVSRTGVTGAGSEIAANISGLVERIRDATSKPIAVGFGVSCPEHAREIAQFADGAVVGSALVDLIRSKKDQPGMLDEVRKFASELKEAARVRD